MESKRDRFVHEYLIDLNATQAAIRAGYSPKTARSQATRLLADVDIAAALTRAQRERAYRTGVTADRVLEELAALAFSDAMQHYEATMDGRLVLAEDAPEVATRAVSSIKRRVRSFTNKDGETTETVEVEFKLWDKNTAIGNVMKHLGMLEPKDLGGKARPLVVRDIDELQLP